jgi:rhamnosyl/mannosyltransferase
MNKKQTLLIVAPYFPPHSGGLERYVKEIAKGVGKRGKFNVEVLTTSEDGKDSIEDNKNYKIHRLAFSFKVSNTPFSFAWFLKVRRLLKTINPDVINIHTPVFGLGDVVAFWANKKTPIVVTYHTGSMKKGIGGIVDFTIWIYEHLFLKYLLGKAKHIVCVSDYVRNNFLAKYKYKSSVITPAVDTKLFYSDNDIKKDGNKLLFVAGLNRSEKYKGLEILLNALLDIVKNKKDVTLTVVGDGDAVDEYKRFVVENKLVNDVFFKGFLFGKELANEYKKVDILVAPTQKESFGMVIAEAMSSGLPVVASNVGGVPKLVEDGITGYLVKCGNVKSLSKKILKLLNDKDKQVEFGKRGEEKIKKDFTWEKKVNEYIKLFKDVLERKKTVAHVVGFYPPHVGGMEIVAKEVSEELAKRNYDVRVFTSDLGAKKAKKIERKRNFILRRLRSVELAHTPVMFLLPFYLLFLPKSSVLHVHIAQAFVPEIALLIAKIRGFKYVAHFHLDVEPSGRLGKIFLLYKKYILGITLRYSDFVIVFSEEQKKLVNDRYGVEESKINIIPNGISDSAFQEHVFSANERLNLLSVARLTNQKRIDRIIEAVGMLNLPVHLTVAGDGEDRVELEKLADKVAKGKVSFVGFVEHSDLKKYYKRADIFVMPSDKEGMPIALLEAMASGLPIVASNVLGIRELVKDVGVLVDNPSGEMFANAIGEIFSSKEKLSILSKKSVDCAKRHTWRESVSKIEKLYI